jgi:hypothetical protein
MRCSYYCRMSFEYAHSAARSAFCSPLATYNIISFLKLAYLKIVMIGRNYDTLYSVQGALAALSIYKSVLLFVLQ